MNVNQILAGLRKAVTRLPGRRGVSLTSVEARDVFATGMFPVCPATHDLGLRWLFDLSTLLLMLDCRPGDRVLDVGAGSGFSSEMMARFGYEVVALDPDREALAHNRRRRSFDQSRIEGSVEVVQGVIEQLPYKAASFDGVLGMNVMHHVPDLPTALSELARVLRPGCRAAFSEPGLDHLEMAETKRAIREHGENDRPFDVLQFLHEAKARGFSDAMLTATLHPPLRLLPVEEVPIYLAGNHPRDRMTPQGVINELHRRHPFAMLVREGERLKTSRHPGVLRGEVAVSGLPQVVHRGARFDLAIRVTNLGDSVWLAKPDPLGGFVTVGCKLLAQDGRLISDRLGRTCIPQDVSPGEESVVSMRIDVPSELSPGVYSLQFDLIDELICWFSDVSPKARDTYTISVR